MDFFESYDGVRESAQNTGPSVMQTLDTWRSWYTDMQVQHPTWVRYLKMIVGGIFILCLLYFVWNSYIFPAITDAGMSKIGTDAKQSGVAIPMNKTQHAFDDEEFEFSGDEESDG